jgi:UrcA family protein
MRRIIPLLLPTLWAAVLAAGSLQAAAGEVSSVKVDLRDLNPHSDAGALAAFNRIKAGARKVSGTEPDLREIATHARWQTSYHLALETGVHETGSGRLETLYAGYMQHRRTTPTQTAERAHGAGRDSRL